ncbi:MAG: alanyl-tRNA editing protein, partial [Oscillospiraceae bacterium]
METQLIFRENPYIESFEAKVLDCREVKNGYNIVLDRTAFYPEGGGQPADLGELDGVSVLDVKEKDGEVGHLCKSPLEIGKNIKGKIDWSRRFTHMQHHTGEHIVSGLVKSLYNFDNVGFHMGGAVTVDFNGELSPMDV